MIVMTYALLDSGSTSSWCSESLAKRLGVVGSRVQVSLSTIETDSTPFIMSSGEFGDNGYGRG